MSASLPVFRPEEIAHITKRLGEGATPQTIADEIGMAHSSFRMKLANSGYRVAVIRILERIVAVDINKESAFQQYDRPIMPPRQT